MQNFVASDVETIVILQSDVLFVAQQINRDLQELSRAYPNVVPLEKAMNLFISYSTFLNNFAVASLGFTVHDPTQSNLVYHEFRYVVMYGGDVQAINPTGGPMGQGGSPVVRVHLPASATFTPWVVWSDYMLGRSIEQQEQIVSGTQWDIPSRCGVFYPRYEGGTWTDLGTYSRGNIGVSGSIYMYESE